jgi:uncharacterized protein YoaH (UPF0181 family)
MLQRKKGVMQERGLGRQLVRHQQSAIGQALNAAAGGQARTLVAQEIRGAQCGLKPGVADFAHVCEGLIAGKILSALELLPERSRRNTFSSE